MTTAEAALVFGAAVLGGGLNAVAGGGGFLSLLLPLVFTNVPPLRANATIAVALWPGFLASTLTSSPPPRPRRWAVSWLLLSSAAGAVVGTMLMLHTPPPVFLHLVPFLILASTLLFAASGRLVARGRMTEPFREADSATPPLTASVLIVQLLIGVYGGYFGANLGLVLLASLSLAGMRNHHAINALVTQLALCNGGVTAGIYAFAGVVLWPQIVVMVAGTIVGGWAGGRFGHRLDSARLHRGIVAAGLAISLYLFITLYILLF
ncbi:sulfite exporter TauE/SafE family protein [Hymenobacter negativus]|uniref:Probable membrane transporter protein n=1 Tax=Hymenobacter negativus TaxID=2795026 RepID=A0ABS3QM88_9BACT|nr:sulfite exporter TauE/SafE family protein [Hymenobacter negativus]MBO2012123.1 sulfite exporter TauE/SafE family protein [Hymenobacter negativus]